MRATGGSHPGETLATRLARGAFPIASALGCALDIAAALRNLHAQGGAHGAVSPAVIVLMPAGAVLLPSNTLKPDADAAGDVNAFGAVLLALLAGLEGGEQPELCVKMGALAAKCHVESAGPPLSIQEVVTELKILDLMARGSDHSAPDDPARPANPRLMAGSSAMSPASAVPRIVNPKAPALPAHRCKVCGSLDTRKSPSRPLLHRIFAFAGATYRCRACKALFLVRMKAPEGPE